MGLDVDSLSAHLQSILKPFQNERWAVGLSGGVDSTVLLEVLLQCRAPSDLVAIHVNHGVQEESDFWQDELRKKCEKRGVLFYTETLKKSTIPSENCLRKGRYEVFARGLTFTQTRILLLAHHAQDQAETLLMRLNRGAGFRGLQGIPAQRPFHGGWLIRPFLRCPRSLLEQYAKVNDLFFFTDPSNFQLDFERNFLRHEIWPRLEDQRPGSALRWAQTASDQQNLMGVLEVYLSRDLERLQVDSQLDLLFLKAHTVFHQSLLLKYWLEKINQTPPLERRHLNEIFKSVIQAKPDANPLFKWGEPTAPWVLRRYRNTLWVFHDPLDLKTNFEHLRDQRWFWDLQSPLHLPQWGELKPDAIRPRLEGVWIKIHYQTGGGNALKKKWQQHGVPPWERHLTPVVYTMDHQWIGFVRREYGTDPSNRD